MTYVGSLRAERGLNDTGEMGGLLADRVLWKYGDSESILGR